jgi:hypothetical protein
VDQTSRAQVRLILDDETSQLKQAVETRLKAIFAKRAATRTLRSGATVKSAVAALEEMGSQYITRCVDRVADVAKDIEAFAMMQTLCSGSLKGQSPSRKSFAAN